MKHVPNPNFFPELAQQARIIQEIERQRIHPKKIEGGRTPQHAFPPVWVSGVSGKLAFRERFVPAYVATDASASAAVF